MVGRGDYVQWMRMEIITMDVTGWGKTLCVANRQFQGKLKKRLSTSSSSWTSEHHCLLLIPLLLLRYYRHCPLLLPLILLLLLLLLHLFLIFLFSLIMQQDQQSSRYEKWQRHFLYSEFENTPLMGFRFQYPSPKILNPSILRIKRRFFFFFKIALTLHPTQMKHENAKFCFLKFCKI